MFPSYDDPKLAFDVDTWHLLKISFRICTLHVLEYDITGPLSIGFLLSKFDLPY